MVSDFLEIRTNSKDELTLEEKKIIFTSSISALLTSFVHLENLN